MLKDDDVAHGWITIKIPELQLIIYISIQGEKHTSIHLFNSKNLQKYMNMIKYYNVLVFRN